MTQLHALASTGLLAALVGYALLSAGMAVTRRAPRWLDTLRLALVATLVAQSGIGAALAVSGAGPAEWLHWLYGAAAVGVLLLAGTFSADASPRPRLAVVAVASLFSVAMIWRLSVTG